MLIDMEGMNDIVADLTATSGRLGDLRFDVVARLHSIGKSSDAARVGGILDAAELGIHTVATNASTRVQLMADAESTLGATLRSAESDARWAAQSLAMGAWVELNDRAKAIDLAAVHAAVEAISELLATDGKDFILFSVGDTDVSSGELREILEIMEGLTPGELEAVFRRLSEDERRLVAIELYNGQGLSAEERARYFQTLAEGLGVAHLVEMVDNLDGDADELAGAIGAHAPPRLAGLVMATIGESADADRDMINAFSAIGETLDADTLTTVATIGYGEGWLFDLIENSFATDTNTTGGGYGTHVTLFNNHDAVATEGLLTALRRVESIDIRADVWVAAVGVLAPPLAASAGANTSIGMTTVDLFEHHSDETSLAVLTAMLMDDPIEMMDVLRLRGDEYGDATVDFVTELLRERGDGGPISATGAVTVNELLAELVGGNPDLAARQEFFVRQDEVVGGGLDYRNAARLGYFAATVSRGLDALEPDGSDAEDTLKLVLGVAGEFSPIDLGPVGTGTAVLFHIVGELEERDLQRLRDDADQFERLLVEQIVPRDVYGNRFEVDAVEEFQGAYSYVVDFVPRNGD